MTESTTTLPGTVKFYQRHLFVCTGQTDWPERIELGGGFLQTLAEAIGAYAAEMPLKVKMTACADSRQTDKGYDILVFPDMVRYVGVETADILTLIMDHLVGNEISPRLQSQPLTGQHVFVCIHGRRDERCGQCGPPLVERFQLELGRRGLNEQITLHQSSHVGGHAFAGNVLIYPTGDWYGFVTPQAVPSLIESHLIHGNIVPELWRGRMGLAPEVQITAAKQPRFFGVES